MKKVVFVIAENNFRDEELFVPAEAIKAGGFEYSIASKKKGVCIGMLGGKAEATFSLPDVGNDFDAIVFVGGAGAKQYFHDAEALGLARKYRDMGKIVAAICIAPVILANSGVLMGKRATAFSNEKASMVGKCGVFTGKPVEIDGRIITASGPSAAKSFGEELVKKLQQPIAPQIL